MIPCLIHPGVFQLSCDSRAFVECQAARVCTQNLQEEKEEESNNKKSKDQKKDDDDDDDGDGDGDILK